MIVKRAVVLMLALLLAYLTWTAVHIDRFDWDLAITQWMQSIPHESLDPLPRLISRMGVLGVAGILGILAILLFWLRGWRTEAAFVAMIGLVDLLNPLFRYAIGRPRPDPLQDPVVFLGEPQGPGFPSGTALHYTLFCGMIIYFTGRILKPGKARAALWVSLGLWTAFMGVWLIYNGRHWASDVLGGILYGLLYLVILISIYRRYAVWRRSFPADASPLAGSGPPLKWIAWLVKIVS